MAAKREPLRSWRFPEQKLLEGRVYPAGKPPFAPFPHVTNLVNANFCPRAAYHDLLHGNDGALLGTFEIQRRGDLFHSFIEYLKSSIQAGRIEVAEKKSRPVENAIRSYYVDFAGREGFSSEVAGDLWKTDVGPWIRRKLDEGELQSITNSSQLYFEITVANVKLPMQLDGGVRHYPLTGRIDEIDISSKKVIERTTKPPMAGNIPQMKDYQCWLLWRLLASTPKRELPSTWRNIDFESFRLIVETPSADYEVARDNPDFITQTHWAYAWINDISVSESWGLVKEIRDNALCSPAAPHPACHHPFFTCYNKDYPYPESRPEIRRVFGPWYRLLLWERMWQSDLWYYRILGLPKSELISMGLITETQFLKTEGNEATLKITAGEQTSVRGYDSYKLVIFGTLSCGKRVDATLKAIESGHLVMRIKNLEGVYSKHGLLIHSPPDGNSALMQPPPGFLLAQSQKGLLKLQNAGVMKHDSATANSVIQLLESVFGTRSMKRSHK